MTELQDIANELNISLTEILDFVHSQNIPFNENVDDEIKQKSILKQFLQWDYKIKTKILDSIFPENDFTLPKSFKVSDDIRNTALEAIKAQKNRKLFLKCLREETDGALNYIKQVSLLYKNRNAFLPLLKDAFLAIAIESQSNEFDWDRVGLPTQ
jgi:hypothetical protein